MTSSATRTVVVTGGSRGIGRAICTSLAEPGTTLFFNYFSPNDPEGEKAAAQETEKQVTDKGAEVQGVWADVASSDDLQAFFDRVLDATGRIDVLVNNAGITRDSLLVRMKDADWDLVMDINLKAAFRTMRIAARTMMKQRSGRIVNIASIVGVIGNAGQANYVASKAGLIGLTKTVAREVAPKGVLVNAVAPGFIETDMTAVLSEKARNTMLSQVPLGRPGQPQDVAAAVKFLCSEESSYLTGQVLHVSGGMFM
ncbi:MAG: 3-oxoacyl-[acyl-carrier-protein] reductase [Desulfobacteraceae bacterium]|jgi:3-oxoacyl-[acyl-carrier protein] reductase|nr:3-oxoacyl-[acyl-carrier-protein] reductase [Desulfobacteraceae bacterium]